MQQLNSSSQNECYLLGEKKIATNLMGPVNIEIVFSGYHSLCTCRHSHTSDGEKKTTGATTKNWHAACCELK